MRVALGTFARSALETQVGSDVPAAVNAALAYHVEKVVGSHGRVPFPRFLADAPDDRFELEIEVDPLIEEAVREDARRQGVSPEDLAEHAVLVYLAEIDRVGTDWVVPESGTGS
jgi:hypothetical protein